MHRYLGIDFSGDQRQWNPNVRRSNVWIATIETKRDLMSLVNLQRVQQLPGHGRPFARLADLLKNENYAAAGIDAPFSIPWWFFGTVFENYAGLLATVNQLPLPSNRDFPTGQDFVASISNASQFQYSKPLRVTECYWRGKGVNVRSSLWIGARPGAPFASACIKLISEANRSAWPWIIPPNSPLLVEAFPAAQLSHWGLPSQGYNTASGKANRRTIVSDLINNRGLQLNATYLGIIKENADALDAVLCSYGARAVVTDQLAAKIPPFDVWKQEGWIAIHN